MIPGSSMTSITDGCFLVNHCPCSVKLVNNAMPATSAATSVLRFTTFCVLRYTINKLFDMMMYMSLRVSCVSMKQLFGSTRSFLRKISQQQVYLKKTQLGYRSLNFYVPFPSEQQFCQCICKSFNNQLCSIFEI